MDGANWRLPCLHSHTMPFAPLCASRRLSPHAYGICPDFPTFTPSLPVVSNTKENPGKQLKQTRRTQRQEPALFIGAYSPDCESPNCEFDEAVD